MSNNPNIVFFTEPKINNIQTNTFNTNPKIL